MILLQEHTRALLEKAANDSPHAIMLTGPEGAGKLHAARYLASKKLALPAVEKLDSYPYFRLVSPENNALTIDQIRSLHQFLQLKTPGTAPVRRIVVLENAEYMTNEAQNALLKSLEEPPADTVIILTAPATRVLRETIYSRVQQLSILPVTKEQALGHFGKEFATEKIEKAYLMSGGHAGLLYALLRTEEDHALIAQLKIAKELISASSFERLARVDELSKQKETLPTLLQACKLVSSAATRQAAQKGNKKQLQQTTKLLDALYRAEAALPRNPNAKLLLTDLFLQM